MADDSGDTMLVKIAVFGIAMSVMCTAMIGLLFVNGTGDYDFESVEAYRDDLISFSGQSMINHTPWVLTDVYTPWDPAMGTAGHITEDGWLYGESVDYPDIGKSADIRMDPGQKSSAPLAFDKNAVRHTYESGTAWWYSGLFDVITRPIGLALQLDPYDYTTVDAHNWRYTGYRYEFDPTLPFQYNDDGSPKTASADGKLSLVWYSYGGQEGLSGGLDVYGGNVLLASYSATDIIADYSSANGLATTYNFDFGGVMLTLSIRFDQEAIDGGTALMQAWVNGSWTMAISSVSAGNFFDLENSTSFTTSAGGMIQTFIQIYTLSLPSVNNPWMDMILWLLVGLPMTIAMLCVTLRLVNGFRVI